MTQNKDTKKNPQAKALRYSAVGMSALLAGSVCAVGAQNFAFAEVVDEDPVVVQPTADLTQVRDDAKKAVNDAVVAAKTSIQGLGSLDAEQKRPYEGQLDQVEQKAVSDLDVATSADAIAAAKKDALDRVATIVAAANRMDDQQALENARLEAQNKLEKSFDKLRQDITGSQLSEALKKSKGAELNQLEVVANRALRDAASLDDLTEAVREANTSLGNFENSLTEAATPAAIAPEVTTAAVTALSDKARDVKAEIAKLQELDDTQRQTFETKIDGLLATGSAALTAATNADALDAEKAQYLNRMDQVLVEAQKAQADQVLVGLRHDAKTELEDAANALTATIEASGLSAQAIDAHKKEVAEAIKEANTALDAAEDQVQIEQAKAAASQKLTTLGAVVEQEKSLLQAVETEKERLADAALKADAAINVLPKLDPTKKTGFINQVEAAKVSGLAKIEQADSAQAAAEAAKAAIEAINAATALAVAGNEAVPGAQPGGDTDAGDAAGTDTGVAPGAGGTGDTAAPGTGGTGAPGTDGTGAGSTVAPGAGGAGTDGTATPGTGGTVAPGAGGTVTPGTGGAGTPGTGGTGAPGTDGTGAGSTVAPGAGGAGTGSVVAPGVGGAGTDGTATPGTGGTGTGSVVAPGVGGAGTDGTATPGTGGAGTPGTGGTVTPGGTGTPGTGAVVAPGAGSATPGTTDATATQASSAADTNAQAQDKTPVSSQKKQAVSSAKALPKTADSTGVFTLGAFAASLLAALGFGLGKKKKED